MERIALQQTDGRGRNGWFRAKEARLLATAERIDLDVMSNRPVIPGPVRLELNPTDAEALALALLRAVAQVRTGARSQSDGPHLAFPDSRTAVAVLDAFIRCQGGCRRTRGEEDAGLKDGEGSHPQADTPPLSGPRARPEAGSHGKQETA